MVCTLVDTEAETLQTIWTNQSRVIQQYLCHVIFTANQNWMGYTLTNIRSTYTYSYIFPQAKNYDGHTDKGSDIQRWVSHLKRMGQWEEF